MFRGWHSLYFTYEDELTMKIEDIEKAAMGYATENSWYPGETSYESDIKAMEESFADAFKAGAQWLADYLCKIPFNEIIDELYEYCANKLKENSYDTGKCI